MPRWTKEEIDFLLQNYRNFSYFEISKKLNKSLGSIYWKAYNLNIKKGRWNDKNKLSKEKVIKLLLKQKNILGNYFTVDDIPISLKSACQRHFGNFNNAKKTAGLKIKEHTNKLPEKSYRPSKELAYIVGALLGDGSFRYQKYKNKTSYVIVFASKDRDMIDYFAKNFNKWSLYKPKITIIKGGSKKFPNGKVYNYQNTFYIQIGFMEAWRFLKRFKDDPKICLNFFSKSYLNFIIKGLWDAEGCIRVEGHTLRIHFSNRDKNLINLYTNILKKFGFNYSINKSNVDLLNEYDIVRFIKLIEGITIKRKINGKILEKINNSRVNEKSFSERVYELTKQIPEGCVSTYRDIAHSLGVKAYRAVGQVLRHNEYSPIVPCHRVVNSFGMLHRFNGEVTKRALDRKARLLEKEGIKVKGNKIVDFEKVLYRF